MRPPEETPHTELEHLATIDKQLKLAVQLLSFVIGALEAIFYILIMRLLPCHKEHYDKLRARNCTSTSCPYSAA